MTDIFQGEIMDLLNALNLYYNLQTKVSDLYRHFLLPRVLPSLELETILKCNLAYTTFLFGSALKWNDLKRAAVRSSSFSSCGFPMATLDPLSGEGWSVAFLTFKLIQRKV